jgi:hypothetical protein
LEGFADGSVGQSGGTTTASLNSIPLVTAVGGAAGVNKSGTNVIINGAGGISPQSGNTGTILFYGGNGGAGSPVGAGGGGGSAGELGNGGSTVNNAAGAAGAGGGVAGEAGLNTTAPGSNGKIPGGGGAGGAVRNPSPYTSNNTTKIGGSGGNGKLVIMINSNLSITQNETLSNDKITLYPNPVNSILHLDFANDSTTKEVTVFNALGQSVYKTKTADSTLQIDVKNWNLKDLVIVQIVSENKVFNYKVLVR